MKKNFLFITGMALFSFACQNGSNSDQQAAKDSTKMTEEAAAVSAKPANILSIWQKVSNYNKWLMAYEAHDSVRLANGLHNYIIGRDLDDSNMVVVALHMDDVEKAKAFAAAPSLKAAMQKGGVIGAPTISYRDVQSLDTTTNSNKTRLSITSKVKDFDAWKKEYDSHLQMRTNAGLTQRSMSFGFDDKNEISLVFMVADVKKAKDFLQSKDLKDRMEASGAIGKPTIHLYTISKKY